MKRIGLLLLLIVIALGSNSVVVFGQNSLNYKSKYEKQLYVNRGMAATAIMILSWFKNHPVYKKFDSIKSRVDQFYKELNKAKDAHFKALDLAKDKKWKEAYESLKDEWVDLNEIVVKGKKTQDDLMELEGKQEVGSENEE